MYLKRTTLRFLLQQKAKPLGEPSFAYSETRQDPHHSKKNTFLLGRKAVWSRQIPKPASFEETNNVLQLEASYEKPHLNKVLEHKTQVGTLKTTELTNNTPFFSLQRKAATGRCVRPPH